MNTLLKIEITTEAVAWYGAIVATLSMLISALKYFRDRTKIKVKVSQGFLAYPHKLDKNIQIFIKAVNIGRRPVTLTSVGVSLKNKKEIVIIDRMTQKLPFKLTEGNQCQAWITKKELLDYIKKEKTCVVSAWYQNASGKIYKAKYNLNYND